MKLNRAVVFSIRNLKEIIKNITLVSDNLIASQKKPMNIYRNKNYYRNTKVYKI
jgi:hypothetical protein